MKTKSQSLEAGPSASPNSSRKTRVRTLSIACAVATDEVERECGLEYIVDVTSVSSAWMAAGGAGAAAAQSRKWVPVYNGVRKCDQAHHDYARERIPFSAGYIDSLACNQ